MNRPSFLTQILSFNRSARLFLLATIADGIVISAWSLFFNFYILERGFDRDFLGLVNALPAVATLLLGIPMGLLADRIGRKRAMLLGVAIYMVCMAVVVTAASPWLIMLTAFIGGAANCLYYLSQAPFMMQASGDENRTLLFSVNFGLSTMAGAVGSLFAGQLPAWFGVRLGVPAHSAAAYQAVLLMSVALSFLTLIPLSLIREPRGKAGEKKERSGAFSEKVRPMLAVVARPLTLKLALPNLCIGFGAAILIPYINVFFRERFAMPDQTLGVLFSLSAALTGIGCIFGPRLAVNLGSKVRAVVLTQGLSLFFMLVIGFSPVLWFVSVAFLMRSTLMNMANPLFSAFAMEQTPERERATVNSVKELAWQFGWAVGPYISGVVQEAYGFTPLFITTAVLYGAATLLVWLFFRDHEASARLKKLEPLEIFQTTGD